MPRKSAKAALQVKETALRRLGELAPELSESEAQEAILAELSQPPPPILGSQTKDLGALMRDGVPEIEYLPSPSLGERLFYAHNVFILAGHKKAGKTWAMMLLPTDQLRARRPVLYIDQDNGIELFAERMLLLGVEPTLVERHLLYEPFPEKLPDLDDLRREIDRAADANPGSLVVLDSMRTFMARYGLNPNADVDIERFLGPIIGGSKEPPAGCASVCGDHRPLKPRNQRHR